ncbi:MAG: hypothetical protein KAR47_13520 [Planctomycetes bacterium]|nr:hypothetical protein [Planctomycetota bacterium]
MALDGQAKWNHVGLTGYETLLKVSENPPIIWPEDRELKDFAGTWWVAHTKSRNEKALAWQLRSNDISYFLPMSWKTSRRKERTIKSLLPLFSGYVFFCGDENDRLEALKTNRVAGLIPVTQQDLLVAELAPIERLLREGAPLRPHKYIKAGQKCRVTAGPLFGTEGIVSKADRMTKLILQVDILGQAASVEIDMEMIELIE